MDIIVVGETYTVIHPRKGTFIAKVVALSHETADLEVVDGMASAVRRENTAYVGDVVRVSRLLCRFTPAPEGK